MLSDLLRRAFYSFAASPWNRKVTVACVAGLLLPTAIHHGLERRTGIRRY